MAGRCGAAVSVCLSVCEGRPSIKLPLICRRSQDFSRLPTEILLPRKNAHSFGRICTISSTNVKTSDTGEGSGKRLIRDRVCVCVTGRVQLKYTASHKRH